MPDYSSLRQLMGLGFLPQGGSQPYPDFAQQGGFSGTMQPLPPSGGYGGWGRSPDVLDANQLAGVGAGWNPQPDVMQPWGPGVGTPKMPGQWNTQMPAQQPQGLGEAFASREAIERSKDMTPADRETAKQQALAILNRPGPIQPLSSIAFYDPYRPWGRR